MREDVCAKNEGGKVDWEEGCEKVGEGVIIVRCEAVGCCHGVGV